MQHSDAQVPSIRVFHYFQVFMVGSPIFALVSYGLTWGNPDFLYQFLRTEDLRARPASSPDGASPVLGTKGTAREWRTTDGVSEYVSGKKNVLGAEAGLDMMLWLAAGQIRRHVLSGHPVRTIQPGTTSSRLESTRLSTSLKSVWDVVSPGQIFQIMHPKHTLWQYSHLFCLILVYSKPSPQLTWHTLNIDNLLLLSGGVTGNGIYLEKLCQSNFTAFFQLLLVDWWPTDDARSTTCFR